MLGALACVLALLTVAPGAWAQTAPMPAEEVMPAASAALGGARLGLSTGYTHYREPQMQLAGANLGLHLRWAQPWGLEGWAFEAHGLLGAPDYDSPVSGAIARRINVQTVWRVLHGRPVGAEPAARFEGGLEWHGYYNDLRGTTSVGDVGYERERYGLWAVVAYQAPVASAQPRGAKSWRLEAAILLQGWAVSRLSQVSFAYSDVVNRQDRGFALRAQRSYRHAAGEVIPYVGVSWVGDSDLKRQPNYSVKEPANVTWQLGVKWFWR
jgi:hypothetical protein